MVKRTRKPAAEPVVPDKETEDLRRALFQPCESEAEMHAWIECFLGIDLPDEKVEESSTATPMSSIWKVYNVLRLRRFDLPEAKEFENWNQCMAYSSRDSFKCVEKGTLLLSREQGLIPIEEVKIGDVIWSGRAWQPVTDWIDDGVKESRELELWNGARLTTSPIHRVWAWSPGQAPGWKRVSELGPDDLVRWDTTSDFATGPVDEQEFELGYLCGLLQGDGCLRFMETEGFVTLSTIDAQVLSFWKSTCLKYTGREPKRSHTRPCDWTIRSRSFCNFLASLGLTPSYAWDKKLPARCRANKSILAGFVSGLFDTDGSVAAQSISFAMTAELLLRDLLSALAAMGVVAKFRTNRFRPDLGQRHQVHCLTINQNQIPRLQAAGVRFRAQKAKPVLKAKTPDAHDGIPRSFLAPLMAALPTTGGRFCHRIGKKPTGIAYKTVTREKARALVEYARANAFVSEDEALRWNEILSTRWFPVKSVTPGRAHFLDLTVAKDHSYWSNGIVSHNTLGAAILEVMVVLHLSLSVAHMAAIEPQAKKAQSYVKDFFRLPFLQDYVTIANEKRTDVVRYRERATGDNISEAEFSRLPTWKQLQYDRRANYITIVICTLSGANSEHVPFMVIDEIDVIRGESVRAFEEAKLIPSAWKGCEPLTLFTSTRKTSFGLVQKELDEAPVTDLQVWHWNILDVTERCPPSRHLPEEPKITIYYQNPERQTRGSAISEETWKLMPAEKQELYKKTTGFKGCLQNCKIFFACRGQLAVKGSTRHNEILKSVNATTQLFKKVSPGMANAQLLCGKPSEEGLIYPHLDNQIHLVSAQAMAELIDGEPHPEIQTKAQLVAFIHAQGLEWAQGLDHGHTHNFAVTTIAKDVSRAFVIDCLAMPGLEMDHKIAHMKALNKTLGINPRVWPDMAGKDQNATLKKHFRIQTWSKGPDSVVAGIEITRSLIYPSFGPPNIYFLAGDEGVELLFLRMSKYHWEVDDAGRSTSQPHKDEDDEADSCRYVLMNEFRKGPNSGLKVGAETRAPNANYPNPEPTQSNYLSHFINQALGQSDADLLYRGDGQDPVGKGKSGGFLWDI